MRCKLVWWAIADDVGKNDNKTNIVGIIFFEFRIFALRKEMGGSSIINTSKSLLHVKRLTACLN